MQLSTRLTSKTAFKSLLLAAFFLPSALLFSQSTRLPPLPDSSVLWVEIRPELDSQFTLRLLFLNKKISPRYLFWRSHLKNGFDLKKDGGDFVALSGDSTLVFFQTEKWQPASPRALEFYVLDNDEMVSRLTWKFSEADAILKNWSPPDAEKSSHLTVISEKKVAAESTAISEKTSHSAARPSNTEPVKPTEITTTMEAQKQPAVASSPTQKPSENKKQFLAKDDFEIDGIVSNETRTAFGRQFFQLFSEKWQPPEGTGGWWISIKEVLTPGRFTLISVSLNNRELFQRYLNPNPDYLKSLAEQTAVFLADLLKNGDPDGGFSDDDLNGKLVE